MTYEEFLAMLRDNYNKMLLTKKETAKELGTSEATIDRLRKNGLITSKKVLGQIMFSIDEIARFLTVS
ncbi:helix-turn-helix domain-containing protein [Sulfurimonas aquatica]|uniref:Helix-turn-helix domain-containing protein n=1 Tax=Sulfurimonas aquatica TaxID=2672570 RepID=A0A975AZB2_9BACT|nr:helix-turn-helix domain-containing protein [Sulfurimonas aquatica]QSZ41356.1 helix-turn-helix domain-containing protein [Sulfurimonas aquatica]